MAGERQLLVVYRLDYKQGQLLTINIGYKVGTTKESYCEYSRKCDVRYCKGEQFKMSAPQLLRFGIDSVLKILNDRTTD